MFLQPQNDLVNAVGGIVQRRMRCWRHPAHQCHAPVSTSTTSSSSPVFSVWLANRSYNCGVSTSIDQSCTTSNSAPGGQRCSSSGQPSTARYTFHSLPTPLGKSL